MFKKWHTRQKICCKIKSGNKQQNKVTFITERSRWKINLNKFGLCKLSRLLDSVLLTGWNIVVFFPMECLPSSIVLCVHSLYNSRALKLRLFCFFSRLFFFLCCFFFALIHLHCLVLFFSVLNVIVLFADCFGLLVSKAFCFYIFPVYVTVLLWIFLLF